jgi:magnesium-transporting ATPase (P-type)
MSVIAKENQLLMVFVKGSPEFIKSRCNNIDDTYDSYKKHTQYGFRVLAMAYRILNENHMNVDRD